MIPFWRLQFWTEHTVDLISTSTLKVAFLLSIVWSFVQKMALRTVDALAFSPTLLGLSMLMVVLDTGTGCYKSLRGDGEVFSTWQFGRVIDKAIKYTVVVLVFSGIAAVGERGRLPELALAWLRDFGYLVIIVREGGSAIENVWGEPLGEVISQFRETVSEASQ